MRTATFRSDAGPESARSSAGPRAPGFSTKTCFPALIEARAIGDRDAFSVETMTASTSGWVTTSSNLTAVAQSGASAATPAALGASRSQANRSRTPGTLARAAARFLPIRPQPMMANDRGLSADGFMGGYRLGVDADAFAGEGAPSK